MKKKEEWITAKKLFRYWIIAVIATAIIPLFIIVPIICLNVTFTIARFIPWISSMCALIIICFLSVFEVIVICWLDYLVLLHARAYKQGGEHKLKWA